MVRDRRMIFAFLSRVPDERRLLNAAILLSRIVLIDLVVHSILAIGGAKKFGFDAYWLPPRDSNPD